MWGTYFCMGAYKRDMFAEIKMGAEIHGVLILCGCLFCVGAYPNFMVQLGLHTGKIRCTLLILAIQFSSSDLT